MITKGAMGATGPSVLIIQYLKSLGIKIRPLKKSLSLDAQKKMPPDGLFGVPLQSLPVNSKEGGVPQLVVDICQFLRSHLRTEGLFRKSGSIIRIKALKAQLESGKGRLESAHPGDVACLLKQFFRELPQPLIPPELQDPLCQIQECVAEGQKGSASTLVTCLLPAVHGTTLRYLCTFLQDVASRSFENRMDSGNLALVLAPNLFSNHGLGEKLTIGAERQLQLQASVMQTLIEHAEGIGRTPAFISEKMTSLCPDAAGGEVETPKEGVTRRRRRRSMGGLVNEALSKLKSGLTSSSATPERASPDETEQPPRSKAKRKASEDSACGEPCMAKKRKSLLAVPDDDPPCADPRPVPDPASPLRDNGIGGDVFLEFPPSPGTFLELTAVPLEAPLTPEPPLKGPRARTKRKEGKRAQRTSQISLSPAHLERREKVRHSLRLFQRSRPAKHPTPEGKNPEESGWNLMKRIVAEALEGPIFNGRELRVAALSVKPANRVNPSCADLSSSRSSLHSAASWKSMERVSVEPELPRGRTCRSMRRSLSMPENVGECAGTGADGCPLYEDAAGSSSAEYRVEGGSREETPEEKMHGDVCEMCPLTSPTQVFSIHSQLSLSSLPSSPPHFGRSGGHMAQYRSVRKLVLSFPWASRAPAEDPPQKDSKQPAPHTIRRQGARRFGRSLSHESGIGLTEETDERKTPEPGGKDPKTLSDRNRRVFVSRKNITLSGAGHQSPEGPADTADLPMELSLSPPTDCLLFRQVGAANRGPESPKTALCLEPS
ncbi:rho GTPase-activating protein 11A-like [Spea bombifrons]|uniref:rho GTPase-activating protein 11A-like n=1 Tax=Spea bombifrons TaxID=233779 RepID=UPI00234AE7DC|nr:rho GTPase-activating protein 11A-like [Spea bombifrons]